MSRPGAIARIFILCSLTLLALQALAQKSGKTTVMHPSGFAETQPLRELPIDLSIYASREMPEPRQTGAHPQGPWQPDLAVQQEALPNVGATLGVSFDGIGAQGFAPSDSNLAVGPNHVVETVNVRLAVYSKNGTLLSGPTNFGTFFAALGGNCAAGASDPIVLYDRAADRWLISDIGYTGSAPFLECIGISKTNDPTGAYFLYSYSFGSTLNDYPKIGVWPTASNSAYLATYNLFGAGNADLCGIDRTKLLAGNNTAAQLCQSISNESSYLPADNDGPTAPVDGTPGLYMTFSTGNPGTLHLRKLTLNFAAGTSSLSAATSISVPNFNPACFSSCVPQLGTSQLLDVLGDRPMYRFPIRHFADHDRAVLNHSVIVTGSQVGVRWYEIYDPAGAVTLNQSGTYGPDTTYRWMASIAEDQNADIGVGYSASSSAIHPAIRFTGRVPSDPAGTLETEASMIEGGGSQTSGLSRWGDYSALQVDPSDDCTFWYVQQYEKVNGSFNWATNVASFKFNSCGGVGNPGITFVPTALNFHSHLSGTKATKKVTVTNSGTATLNISNIVVTGTGFTLKTFTSKLVTPCKAGIALAPGASCVTKVTFSPASPGSYSGNLTFTDNAPASPQSVHLSGTGT